MLYVVTGGARSGKSGAAELLAQRIGLPVVVVAAGAVADDEMARRIEAHRAARPMEWRTVELEQADSWRAEVAAGETLLLECLGTLAARIMDDAASDAGLVDPWEAPELPRSLAEEVERRVGEAVDSCVRVARGRDDAHLVVVTNEVGDGVVPGYPSGRLFRDCLGRANRRLVDAADGAWLVVAGRCIDLTAAPTAPTPAVEKKRTEH